MGYTGADLKELEAGLRKDMGSWQRLQDLLEKYRGQRGSLLEVLQQVQEIYGYLPQPVLQYLAGALRIKATKIYGVATFYSQFRLEPVGKHLILFCQGTACHVNGAERVKAAVCERLGIRPGGTTPDRLFTLSEAACLGCCSLAPVMMIDGQAYGPLTPERAFRIIGELATAPAGSGEGR